MNLQSKTLCITGAGQGIGRALALCFAEAGANIALIDMNAETLAQSQAQCEALGVSARTYIANVADEAAVEATMDRIVADFGRLDGLVNNAGILRDALLIKVKDGAVVGRMSYEQWKAVIDVNLTGVQAMAVTWAKELARYGIRAASIAPGFVHTDILAAMKPEALEKVTAPVPLKRLGQADEIAHAARFIFENDFFTGRCLELDGGLRL